MLCLADDPVVASFEFGALLGSPYTPTRQLPNPNLPCVIVPVQVRLARVLDLTDAAAQQAIGMSAQELTGDWDGYALCGPGGPAPGPTGLAPTQVLGSHISRLGVEGFLSVSARVPDHRTLTIFPHRLGPGSALS